jgi:hypothetical protein
VLIISRASARRLGAVETTVDIRNCLEDSPKATKPQVSGDADLRFWCTPPGTRTPNPLVKRWLRGVSGGVE